MLDLQHSYINRKSMLKRYAVYGNSLANDRARTIPRKRRRLAYTVPLVFLLIARYYYALPYRIHCIPTYRADLLLHTYICISNFKLISMFLLFNIKFIKLLHSMHNMDIIIYISLTKCKFLAHECNKKPFLMYFLI